MALFTELTLPPPKKSMEMQKIYTSQSNLDKEESWKNPFLKLQAILQSFSNQSWMDKEKKRNINQYNWKKKSRNNPFSSVLLLSHVHLFVTPWTAACQSSLSIIYSWSLLKLMSI